MICFFWYSIKVFYQDHKDHDHRDYDVHDDDLHFLLLVELLVRHDGGGGVVGGLLKQYLYCILHIEGWYNIDIEAC